MDKEKYLQKLHIELLDIMDVIAQICDSNNIKYYLAGGTLLGAVRHKGFIPWDDDLDIAMPRSDYNKFIMLCKSQLPKDYSLAWFSTEENYEHVFAKVYKTNTMFKEELLNEVIIERGIFIDIFPLDITSGMNKITRFQKKIIGKAKSLLFKKLSSKRKGTLSGIFLSVFKISTIARIVEFVSGIQSKKGEFYSNFGSQYSIEKQTIRKDVYGEGVLLPFENRTYRVASEYSIMLESIFGNSYMQLPPEDKRRTHYPLEVRFSDGEQILFEKTLNRLEVDR